ncbi:hypothetical protein, partial [uncultured Caballeronia sp.]|uniref:hypothetical protein n=1 Tax=uncultured Caballeronia sp. TaxID=1827198 RepID=UPI0035CCA14E
MVQRVQRLRHHVSRLPISRPTGNPFASVLNQLQVLKTKGCLQMSSSRVWMLKWSMPVIYAAFALAACGGDDAKTSNNSPDSGNGTPANTAPDTPSSPSTPSTPAITAFIYEGLTPDTS